MSTLILTLNLPSTGQGQPSPEFDWCLASNAHTVSSHGSAAIALLPRAQDTVLLLPGAAVSWHRVTLPKLGRSVSAQKMRAVMDGLIEEQLLDDTAALHIASYRPAGEVDANACWLAVCDKAWLVQQVQAVQAAGLSISRIAAHSYPVAAEPSEPGGSIAPEGMGSDGSTPPSAARVHVSGTPETASITVANAHGVLTAALAQARAVWPGLADAYGLGAAYITAEPAVAAAAEAALGCKVAIVQSSQQALQALLDARSMGLDLAQGDLAVAGRGRWLQQVSSVGRDLLAAPAWRAARWGAVWLLLAHVVGLNAWAWNERTSLEAKRRQTSQILSQTFPNVKVVVDAPVQMQRELAVLRQASGGLGNRDLESMLARFALQAPTATAPTAIEFASGEVVLKGAGLNATQLAEFQPKLRSAGLAARVDGERIVLSEAAPSGPGGAP